MDLKFLKKKYFGLPLWAWAGILAALMFLLYLHFKNKGGTSSNTSNTSSTDYPSSDQGYVPDQNAGGSGGGDSGGISGGGGGLGDLGTPDYSQPLIPYFSGGAYPGYFDPFNTTTGLNSPNPLAAASLGPTLNPLSWGGQNFTSQAAFKSWLTARGGNLADFQKNHPAAYALYSALPKGSSPSNVNTTAGTKSVSASVSPTLSKNISKIGAALGGGALTAAKNSTTSPTAPTTKSAAPKPTNTPVTTAAKAPSGTAAPKTTKALPISSASGSGAGAVKSGTAKINYQARKQK